MKSTERAIRDRLLADGPVLALVKRRVYNRKPPQDPTFPLITLWQVNKTSELTLDGVPGMNIIRVQIDAWGSTPDSVREVASVVNGDVDQANNGPLHGFSGSSGGLTLRMVRLLSERAPEYEEESNVYRVGADYEVRL